MKPSQTKVLDTFKKNGRKGITAWDFGRGFDMRKRLSELRQKGYKMTDVWEDNMNGGRHKRFFLIGLIK